MLNEKTEEKSLNDLNKLKSGHSKPKTFIDANEEVL